MNHLKITSQKMQHQICELSKMLIKRSGNKDDTCPWEPKPALRCSTISVGSKGFVSCKKKHYETEKTKETGNLQKNDDIYITHCFK